MDAGRFRREDSVESNTYTDAHTRHHQDWLTRKNTARTGAVKKQQFGESGRVQRGNKLHWKKHAEAPNQVADAGHLHEKTQMAGLRRKRAIFAVGVLIFIACFEVACTAFVAQICSRLRVTRVGFDFFQLRHDQLRVEKAATVSSMAANGGAVSASANSLNGMDLSSNGTLSLTHRASFGTSSDVTALTVGGTDSASVAAVRAASFSVNINEGTAWFNSSRTLASLRCADSQPLSLTSVDARDSTVELGRIQSASATHAIDISANGDVSVAAIQTLSIHSGPTTNNNVGVVATGADAKVAIDAPLQLRMVAGSLELDVSRMAAAHKPDSFASLAVTQVCLCGTTSVHPGTLYVMPPHLACADRAVAGAFPGRDPCVV
eukprot:m.479696 g.479696  ORF g.479696 m.479696 type:complete len:377 (+) comp21704_c2_seq4:527-1657(+)